MGGEPKQANGSTLYVNPYMRKPVNRTWLETIKRFFWNAEEGKILTRTPKSWGILGCINLTMYLATILLFYICWRGFWTTMNERKPKWTLGESIIGTNPGLGHRPRIDEELALIWYSTNETEQVKKYVNDIEHFLKPYKNKTELPYKGEHQINCSWSRKPNRSNESCAVDVLSALGNCTLENSYGYSEGKPCIIIKLNKIYGWEPNVITTAKNSTDYDQMPPELVSQIDDENDEPNRRVWLSCFGERSADREAIGPLAYYPKMGVPEYFFPYENSPDYLSPIVAVQFLNITRHRVVNVRCRGWAHNLKFANSLGFSDDRLGSTHLEIMID